MTSVNIVSLFSLEFVLLELVLELVLELWFSCFRYKNKTVAIKIIKKGESPEEIAKRDSRFAREVSMLSKVQHKNLVKVQHLSC